MPPSASQRRIVPNLGDTLEGKYRLDSEMGAGGMAVVFGATHLVTGRRLAIKVMRPHVAESPNAARRFLEEARASARIAHRNVVDVFDTGEVGGLPYLVMERLEGSTLADLLRMRGRLTVPEAVAVISFVGRGVAAAHERGVIHRDLTPQNIFLPAEADGSPGEPKVLDFGISRMEEAGGGPSTDTGGPAGTPHYMAPEQMTGGSAVARSVDVYSLGVVLFEMVSGERPYVADTLASLVLQVHTGHPRSLKDLAPDVPREIVDVTASAIELDPDRRPASVSALLDALVPSGHVFDRAALPRPLVSSLGESPDAAVLADRASSTSEAAATAASPERREPRDMPSSATSGPTAGRRVVAWIAIGALGAAGLSTSALVALGKLREPRDGSPFPAAVSEHRDRGTIRVHALRFGGASLYVDGEFEARLDESGHAIATVGSGRRFVELRVDGVPRVSTMTVVGRDATVDMSLDADATVPPTTTRAVSPAGARAQRLAGAGASGRIRGATETVLPMEPSPRTERPPSADPSPTCQDWGPAGVCLDGL